MFLFSRKDGLEHLMAAGGGVLNEESHLKYPECRWAGYVGRQQSCKNRKDKCNFMYNFDSKAALNIQEDAAEKL